MQALERLFHLTENGTTARTEMLAGVTTFLTMAYIIFVQPAVLSGTLFGIQTGMDFGAVMTATCVSAAIATVIMALYARYPIALGIPLAYSIADGLAFGFITYPVIKVLSGRAREIRWPMAVVCVILLMYFVLIRS